MQEKQLLKYLSYPLFKITAEWQKIKFCSEPYVAWSEIKGFIPVIDVQLPTGLVRTRKTMIINQTSLGRLMLNIVFMDGGTLGTDHTNWYEVRKTDDGKFAAIELRRAEATLPPLGEEDDDE